MTDLASPTRTFGFKLAQLCWSAAAAVTAPAIVQVWKHIAGIRIGQAASYADTGQLQHQPMALPAELPYWERRTNG